jgi:hypothetical protein
VIDSSTARAQDDAALVRILEPHVLVRLVRRWMAPVRQAYGDSAAMERFRVWTALPLDRRIRLSALAIGTGVVVHLLLTRFSAPQPTVGARIVWVGVLGVIALTGVGAPAIAAAWRDRLMRRHERSSGA